MAAEQHAAALLVRSRVIASIQPRLVGLRTGAFQREEEPLEIGEIVHSLLRT